MSLESGEMCEKYKEKVTVITTARMGGNGVAYCLTISDVKAWYSHTAYSNQNCV